MIKKLFSLFILIQSIALSEWNLIEVPLNKEETLFKKELMFELNSSSNLLPILNISDDKIIFTIFKKDGENPFKKNNTTFKFKVDNKLIESKPTSGSTFGDDTTLSISTLIIDDMKYNEIIEAFKKGSAVKILIMNSNGVKMLFDIPHDSCNKQIHELNLITKNSFI